MEKSCIWNFNYVENENRRPKSYEELCELFPSTCGEYYINAYSGILQDNTRDSRDNTDKNLLPDRATAEAVLSLCQLVQLRNCYNGEWVPDWNNQNERKYIIIFSKDTIEKSTSTCTSVIPLYFKSEELRDEFMRNFRPLIEKLKPLYGIKEGGEK